jgi:hypothetical protein
LFIYTAHTFKLTAKPSKKYMLRLINVTLNNELFFCVADHTIMVFDIIDALYAKPFTVNTLVIASRQTSNIFSSPPSRCTPARGTTWRRGGRPHAGHI